MDGQIQQRLCAEQLMLGNSTACSLTELQIYSATAVFHAISSRLSQYMPLNRTPVPHITMLHSPHITQHGKVCACVKLRGPLLKQASQRQLPAAQSRPMHYSCSFTQPPISLSWVHHFQYCSLYNEEAGAHCTEIHNGIGYYKIDKIP